MRDGPLLDQRAPGIPGALRRIDFGIDELMLMHVGQRRQTHALDIGLARERNEMQPSQGTARHAARGRRIEAEDHVRLVFMQVLEISRALHVHLDFRIGRGKAPQFRHQERDAEPVGNSQPHRALGLALFRAQVAGDREKPLVETQELVGERLALLGELGAVLRQDDELRAHLILQPPDFAADGGVAGSQYLGGAAQAAGLGDAQKRAQLAPVVAAQKAGVVDCAGADRRRRRVERMRRKVVFLHRCYLAPFELRRKSITWPNRIPASRAPAETRLSRWFTNICATPRRLPPACA